ncbi:MAG: C25 family cysteine peptidase [Candidatus Thermoplasmatota archaeon]|nr:C25 family cysteine peptidase [Candidatus Thermoplasmatota archaeon]
MKQNINKKTLAFGIVLLFFGLSMAPTINAVTKINSDSINARQLSICDTNIGYKLLIISPSEFAEKLEPLVTHKENIGLSTKLVTLDEIDENMFWHGSDKQEKIKYFIKDAIEEWQTEYVLLVGGKKGQLPLWYLPVRYVNMGNDWEPHYVSDLYYADIYDSNGNFSSWDSDGDGIYGEWNIGNEPEDKNIDLYPDVAVGRLPCRNSFEVQIMVNKIIEYETTTYGTTWFNDIIAIAGDTYLVSDDPLWQGYEGEYYADRAIENMTGFNPIRLYTSEGTFNGQSDVLNALNNGCGFVYLVGHGNPQTWGNHPPDDHEFVKGLTVQKMHKLKNKHMYPVCVVSGCHNCQFDVSVLKLLDQTAAYRGEATPECWGWRMTRKIGGGAIATFGCTALGHTKEDKSSFAGGINELEVQLFKQYGQNEVEILGDIWAQAFTWYLDTYPVDWDASESSEMKDVWYDVQVIQSYILFGDPSLKIGGYSQ